MLSYVHDETAYDADSLAAALVQAYETRPNVAASVPERRRRERREIADVHEAIYLSLAR